MKSPFRKLLRIAIALLVVVLLFNFFAYYLIYLKSRQNEKMAQVVNIAGYQRSLCQMIAKQASGLLNTPPKTEARQKNALELQTSIETFVARNQFLRNHIESLKDETSDLDVFDITRSFTNAQTHFKSLVMIAGEIASADSLLPVDKKDQYLSRIAYSENKFFTLINAVAEHYTALLTSKIEESTNLNTGKLISLIFALLCLIILVLEPLFRSNKNHYNQLQTARNELLQEKKHLSSILNSQTNYVIRINQEGNFTYANPAFLKTFGYTDEMLMGKPFYTTVQPKELQRCKELADACWKNPGVIQKLLIRKTINKSHQFQWVAWEFIALIDENGDPEIQGIGINVTDKVKAEADKEQLLAEVKQSEELLRTVIDSTPNWIFIKDPRHRFLLVNQAFADNMHKAPKDFIGRNDIEMGIPEEIVKGNIEKDIRGMWADDDEVIKTGKTIYIPEEPAFIDGKPQVMSAVKVPLRDAEGFVWGVLGFSQNITERKKQEEDLHRKDQLLQAVAEATHQLISNNSLEDAIGEAIHLLGIKMQLDMVGVYKNHFEATENKWYTRQMLCWSSLNGELLEPTPPLKINHSIYDCPFLKP
jgi:PAS domain S-box-containing protein